MRIGQFLPEANTVASTLLTFLRTIPMKEMSGSTQRQPSSTSTTTDSGSSGVLVSGLMLMLRQLYTRTHSQM